MRSLLLQPGRATVASLAEPGPLEEWEALWAPYDEATYAPALAAIEPSDVVLDIGAGDLRLTRRIAERAKQVIAWEIQPALVNAAVRPLPPNLAAIVADVTLRDGIKVDPSGEDPVVIGMGKEGLNQLSGAIFRN